MRINNLPLKGCKSYTLSVPVVRKTATTFSDTGYAISTDNSKNSGQQAPARIEDVLANQPTHNLDIYHVTLCFQNIL